MTKARRIASTLIHQARLVSVGSSVPTGEPVDIRIKDGVVVAVATGLRTDGDEQVIDAAGRWAIPGLWDQHVHMVQWAKTLDRLDLSGTSSPSEVAGIVGESRETRDITLVLGMTIGKRRRIRQIKGGIHEHSDHWIWQRWQSPGRSGD